MRGSWMRVGPKTLKVKQGRACKNSSADIQFLKLVVHSSNMATLHRLNICSTNRPVTSCNVSCEGLYLLQFDTEGFVKRVPKAAAVLEVWKHYRLVKPGQAGLTSLTEGTVQKTREAYDLRDGVM